MHFMVDLRLHLKVHLRVYFKEQIKIHQKITKRKHSVFEVEIKVAYEVKLSCT